MYNIKNKIIDKIEKQISVKKVTQLEDILGVWQSKMFQSMAYITDTGKYVEIEVKTIGKTEKAEYPYNEIYEIENYLKIFRYSKLRD